MCCLSNIDFSSCSPISRAIAHIRIILDSVGLDLHVVWHSPNMISLWKLLLLSMALGSLAKTTQGYKIGLVCALARSHVLMMGHLAEKLVKKGHDVTLVLPSSMKIPPDIVALKINTIGFNLKESTDAENKNPFGNMPTPPSFVTQLKWGAVYIAPSFMEIGYNLLEDTDAMNKLADKKLDFMIIDPVVITFLLVPYKLGVPFAIYHSDCFEHIRRIPSLPSVIPHTLLPYSERMSFYERTANTIYNALQTVIQSTVRDMSSQHIPELPGVGIVDMVQNASLCILLRDSVLDIRRPVMPDVIPVATIIGRPAKPLTGDLLKFMDSSPQGVILISFGSSVDELAVPALKTLFTALGELDERVIFKSKQKVNNAPDNVHILDWMPQNDLLAHPNMRLFVTHGGMNSYIEAVYQGVPLLVAPFAIDQHGTAALVKSQGFGEILDLNDFTSDELKNLITTITRETRYKTIATKLSAIFRELQASGLRDPVFWIEHVIKYGASHLRSHAYDMPFYQYVMFDVSVFLVACGLLVAMIMFLFCRCMIDSLCGKPKGKKKIDWFWSHSIPPLW